MKTFFVAVALALGAVVLAAVGGGLLVLLAYAVGRVVNLALHVQPFEATLLSLIGICAAGVAVVRLALAFVVPALSPAFDDEDWGDLDENEDADAAEAEETAELDYYPGIPRWRQPLRRLDFSQTKPDDRCPCGSGRKFKNCHGRKPLA